MAEAIAIFFLLFGVFFFIVGIVGLLRFPDVYTRIHASGKVSTLGMVGLLIATAILMPETTLKVIALVIFLVTTQPVASHVVASAAHRSGVPMVNAVRDDLADREAPSALEGQTSNGRAGEPA